MNKKAVDRLTEFLDTECDDYGLSYDYKWEDGYECFEVDIDRDIGEYVSHVRMKYNEDNDVLSIEMGEDCWYETKEYDSSVKYFWMVVSPAVFR